MAEHKWKIRIELYADDGEMPSTTSVEIDGEHDLEMGRSVNECLAIDVWSILKMLHASSNWIRPTELKDTLAVFVERAEEDDE